MPALGCLIFHPRFVAGRVPNCALVASVIGAIRVLARGAAAMHDSSTNNSSAMQLSSVGALPNPPAFDIVHAANCAGGSCLNAGVL